MKHLALRSRLSHQLALLVVVAFFAVACGGETTETVAQDTTVSDPGDTNDVDDESEDADASTDDVDAAEATSPAGSSTFTANVWADNWFALYVNGELVGEDSVPITTERSFNAETITFEATYPLTIAIEAKDFKETDSGIEYIGAQNQQMGDGGLIAQFIDDSSGATIATTDGSWAALSIHRAPLNTSCEKDADPDATCEFEIIETPADWTSTDFDQSSWSSATEWSEADVSPKDGYDEITWDGAASLIWGADLEVDNTVLFRTTVSG